jgi:bleomycin hydrolase
MHIIYYLCAVKLKTTIVCGAVLALLAGGCAHQPSQYTPNGKHFSIDVLNRMTPVKDQGESQTCWIYAMLATIETEHLSWGDSVNLSPYYIEKMIEQEPACPASKRGECTTLIRMIGKYGICGFDAMRKVDTPAPKWVFMLGATYTPQEFARSVCKPGEYIALTCNDSKPYYEESELEVADNWTHERYLNIPIDSLLTKTERAIRQHHGVCWEDKNHAMAIVGLAHDEAGERYFVMKNSWGKNRKYDGLEYYPIARFRKETVAVEMTRTAYEE